VKINCISCGFTVNLDDATYSDYEGQVKCFACNALLEVKVDQGSVKKVMITGSAKPTPRERAAIGQRP